MGLLGAWRLFVCQEERERTEIMAGWNNTVDEVICVCICVRLSASEEDNVFGPMLLSSDVGTVTGTAWKSPPSCDSVTVFFMVSYLKTSSQYTIFKVHNTLHDLPSCDLESGRRILPERLTPSANDMQIYNQILDM